MSKDKTIQAIKKNDGGYDLFIERDSGNPVRILMGGNKDSQYQSWSTLRDLSMKVLARLDHPSIAKHDPEGDLEANDQD